MKQRERPRAQAGVRAWLDERTGYQAALSSLRDYPVRGGASWAYVYGVMLLLCLLNQAVTGIVLAAFYSPSATTAWASVAHIQDELFLGWFVRGMHSLGASMLVVTMLLHLVQTTVYGAYQRPRELTWVSGLLLAALVLGFALTGYLLPWDQKGYWATQVVTTLLGATPWIGPTLQTLVQGGPRYGHLTLTHFFALHAIVLPALCLLLCLLHILLFRRHGVTPRWGRTTKEIDRSTEPYWPRQAVYDLTSAALLLLFMVAWVVTGHGAPLLAPADPTSAFEARPEWYYLPVYQLLKYFPGPLEVAAAWLGPLLIGGVLVSLPRWDLGPGSSPWQRRRPLFAVGLLLFAAVGLGIVARVEDHGDPRYARGIRDAEQEAARARALARKGVLPAGGIAVYQNDPLELGRQLFAEHCAGCHRLGVMGPVDEADIKGPELSHYGSRARLQGFFKDPDAPAYFGRTKIHGMKPVDVPAPEMSALVEYVYGLSGARDTNPALAAQGQALFSDRNCDTCHELDGVTEGEGPNLRGHAGVGWVRGLLVQPASPLYYGDKSDMPSFKNKLAAEELDQLAAFIAAQRDVSR